MNRRAAADARLTDEDREIDEDWLTGWVGVVVSRETLERLRILVGEVRRWQRGVQLVSPNTLPDIWLRHVADSAQVLKHAESMGTWCDLGSGGGFPGLVIAALRPTVDMHLLESDTRKCAFLRQTSRRMGLEVQVAEGRIEQTLPRLADIGVITARAFAPLDRLLGYAQEPLRRGAIGIFPKGERWHEELTRAQESWSFACDLFPSATDSAARIVRVRAFQGRAERGRSGAS